MPCGHDEGGGDSPCLAVALLALALLAGLGQALDGLGPNAVFYAGRKAFGDKFFHGFVTL